MHYLIPLPAEWKGRKIPIRLLHGNGKRSNCTAKVVIMYPDTLYTDVVYLDYYGTKELFTVCQVTEAYYKTIDPLPWPHQVPMHRHQTRQRRRRREKCNRERFKRPRKGKQHGEKI